MAFAYWRKCDFQVHTPRDPNWQGTRPVGLGDVIGEKGEPAELVDVNASRHAWAEAFIDQCLEKELEAVAITDHHEMVMYPYVRNAVDNRIAADADFAFWAFPGMELTAKGGCQCIIIFDIDTTEEQWRQAQGRLGIDFANTNENASQGPKVTQLAHSYPDLAEQLDAIKSLTGKYIILPNISQGGKHTVLKDGHHAEFLKMSYVGGYLDNGQTIDTLTPKCRTRLSGEDKTWSDREIYPLPTSDTRSATYKDLGKNDTWIKLSEPTAEAIRQAFLGHKSRISVGPPNVPTLTISNVSLAGSSILNDAEIQLSPELNSIIGGRGSGKSSFLEYLAFSVGRSCYDLEKEQYSGSIRMAELVKGTLISKSGSVQTSIIQDGARFNIVRNQASDFQPVITYPDGSRQSLSTKELRDLFPCITYSQGELSEIGKEAGKKTQLSDLLQFVNSDYKKEDDELMRKIDTNKAEVRRQIQELSSHWQDQAQLRQLTTKRSAVLQRVVALEKTLPQLSPEDQAHLQRYEEVSDFESKRKHATAHIAATYSDLQSCFEEHNLDRDLPQNTAGEAKEFVAAYRSFHSTFKVGLPKLLEDLRKQKEGVETAELNWLKNYNLAKQLRDGALEKLGEHKTATSQIIKLKEEIEGFDSAIEELNQKIKKAQDPSAAFANGLNSLKSIVNQRASRIQEWATEIETLSNNRIRATVEVEANISEVREALDTLCKKTGAQEAKRLRELDEAIQDSSFWDILDKLRSDTISILKWRTNGNVEEQDQPKCEDLFAVVGDTERIRTTLSDQIDLARVEAVSVAIPHPEITLTYCDKGKEISFEKASEGQRATALLFMLLEQEGGPLIIDQPEGDLDNKIITDLTEVLHDAKRKRQIIFVSHNANIVVNGSSELVGYIDVSEQGERKFEKIGAIDDHDICELITTTMEGGEKAFKDRQSKYGY